MIKLTMIEGDAVYLSPERITGVYCGGQATSVSIGGEEAFSVTESPEEVARKVLEYNLNQIQLNAAYREFYKNMNASSEYTFGEHLVGLRALARNFLEGE